jgi:protein TonB
MRHLPIIAVILAASASGAMAQEGPAAARTIENPQWLRRPNRGEIVMAYPYKAELAAITGGATLKCSVTADGAPTDCKVLNETARGFDFGKGALKLAPRYRMAPTTSDGAPVAGATVVFPVLFQLSD